MNRGIFSGASIRFLEHIPALESLVLHDWKIKSLASITTLKNLDELSIGSRSAKPISLAQLLNVRILGLDFHCDEWEWTKLPNLEQLFLGDFPHSDLSSFDTLQPIVNLDIIAPQLESFRGLRLSRLEKLEVRNSRKLKSIEGIEECEKLEDIHFNGSTLHSMESVRQLPSLRRILLSDCRHIESILALKECPELDDLIIYGSSNIRDGRIKWLLDMPNLKKVWIRPRKHYDIPAEELNAIFERRAGKI